jgi:TolB-like protein/Tfp pilus assembly protein PilF
MGDTREATGAKMNSFFRELKQRKVYRVALGYAVVGWLVIQIASTVLPTFHVPEWVLQALTVIVALGFPVALVLAWAFDVTPSGVEKTPGGTGAVAARNRRSVWLLAGVGLLIAALAVGGYWVWHPWRIASTASAPSTVATPTIPEKSIAVLPFENLSRDPDNAYFADGIQDEILTRLSKIADLKVISRTSTQTYKSAPRNLREIAQQLGVSNILEGRIQKSADQVRVTVQLINAVNDSHLWAESYDRKLSDVFQVESDVAQKIATALEARLTGREKNEISSAGTENLQAYEAYLRALAAYRGYDDLSLQPALLALQEALRADPDFAAAWALLARIHARVYFIGLDQTEATRVAARKAVETALRLQPELAEAQIAKGFYEYYVVGDYDAARRTFEQLRSRWSNNAEIVKALGLIALRQSRWSEGREYFDAAIALDPRDLDLRKQSIYARRDVRDFSTALRTIDEALAIWPNDTNLIGIKASVYQALGELDKAGTLLRHMHPSWKDLPAVVTISRQAALRRDPAPAIALLQTLSNLPSPMPPTLRGVCHFFLGNLERVSGNANQARANFTQAREALVAALKQQPQNSDLVFYLAQTLAGLGEREAALREADHAVELFPSSRDARTGPQLEEMRARIQARFGDGNRAIPVLEHLLKIPYNDPLTPALLRLNPDFDQLRSDPRFQELCKDKRP